MDPVIALVGLYRIAGSLLVLRWPFWGGVAAVVCDLFDLLLFNVAAVCAGWPGFGGYQAFDKWIDQVYLAAFLVVALRDFSPGPRLVAGALYLFRLAGFAAFEAGWAPREVLLLFPNVFELWFLAVACTLRYRPAFAWTPARSAVVVRVSPAWAYGGDGRSPAACLGSHRRRWAAQRINRAPPASDEPPAGTFMRCGAPPPHE